MLPTDNKLYQMLGRMEGKIDAMAAAQCVAAERAKEVEARVRGLEAFRSRAIGAASVIGGTIIAAVAYMWNTILNFGGPSA